MGKLDQGSIKFSQGFKFQLRFGLNMCEKRFNNGQDHVHHFTDLFSQRVFSSFFYFYTGPCNSRVDTADEAIEFHRMSETDVEP